MAFLVLYKYPVDSSTYSEIEFVVEEVHLVLNEDSCAGERGVRERALPSLNFVCLYDGAVGLLYRYVDVFCPLACDVASPYVNAGDEGVVAVQLPSALGLPAVCEVCALRLEELWRGDLNVAVRKLFSRYLVGLHLHISDDVLHKESELQ